MLQNDDLSSSDDNSILSSQWSPSLYSRSPTLHIRKSLWPVKSSETNIPFIPSIMTSFEFERYKKNMSDYHLRCYKFYAGAKHGDIFNEYYKEKKFTAHKNECEYFYDQYCMRCVICGKEEPITTKIDFPSELLGKILRSRKDLWFISRSLCKSVRNACTGEIVKNELMRNVKSDGSKTIDMYYSKSFNLIMISLSKDRKTEMSFVKYLSENDEGEFASGFKSAEYNENLTLFSKNDTFNIMKSRLKRSFKLNLDSAQISKLSGEYYDEKYKRIVEFMSEKCDAHVVNRDKIILVLNNMCETLGK